MGLPNGVIAEQSLFGLLTDVYSVEKLVLEGFSSKYLPTTDIRFIYDWAIEQYVQSGNLYAPTAEMFHGTPAPGYKKTLADVLDDNGIDINVVSDQTVEWCIQQLKASWLRSKAIGLAGELAATVNEAMADDMLREFNTEVSELVELSMELETRRTAVNMVAEADDIMARYEAREANQDFRGMTMGLPAIDAYTNGIDPGDLAVLAGAQKSGKSYWLDRIALKELEAGHSVTLVTLENGIDMTIDRIACLATGIHPSRMRTGKLTPDEKDSLATWIHDDFKPMEEQLWIVKPPQGQRTAEIIARQARSRRADALLIDQLLWMEDIDTKPPLNQRIRQRMETIKLMIESTAHPMPCLMAHQVNRIGIESARKAGRLWPNDMAEGAAVEQGVDWLFSIWQSDDMKVANQVLFQTLASRHETEKNWDVYWDIETGQMQIIGDRTLE